VAIPSVDTLRIGRNNHFMNEKEYRRLKKAIQDDHRKKLEALDLVWQMSNDCAPPKPLKPQNATKPGENPEASRGKTATVVEEAVSAAGKEFSTKEIAKWISEKLGPDVVERSTISHSLRRMKSIELVKKGLGKSPSLWRKLESDSAAQMSTPQQADEIRELVRAKDINPTEFKENVLLRRFGVERLVALNAAQAQEILGELTQQPTVAKG